MLKVKCQRLKLACGTFLETVTTHINSHHDDQFKWNFPGYLLLWASKVISYNSLFPNKIYCLWRTDHNVSEIYLQQVMCSSWWGLKFPIPSDRLFGWIWKICGVDGMITWFQLHVPYHSLIVCWRLWWLLQIFAVVVGWWEIRNETNLSGQVNERRKRRLFKPRIVFCFNSL